MNAGRLSAATRYLRSALARAHDAALRARVEASLAYVATDRSDLESALRQCEKALAFADLSPDVRGVLLCQRAVVLLRSGRAAEALESFAEAIDDLRELPGELAKAHLNRGVVHLDRGDPGAAAADFSEAARQYELAGEIESGAKADHNLGYALFRSGDLVGALRTMADAQRVLAPISPINRAVGEQDRAEVLLAAGLVTEGTAALRAAARAYGTRRLRQRQAQAELTLAGSLQNYDVPAALAAARSARRRFKALGADQWRVRAEAEVLMAEVDLGRTGVGLVMAAEQVAAELDEQGLRWPAVSTEILGVRLRVRRGELDEALRAQRRLRVPASAPLATRLLHADLRAELAAASGRRATALGHLRNGLAELHDWQSSFGSLDLQTNVVGHGARLARRGLELAVESRSPRVLFEWSERARMLASRVQPVKPPADPQLAADLTELRGSPSPAREAELRQRIRQQAWQQAGSGEVADPVSLAELQADLEPGCALIAYVVAAGRVVALVVTSADTVRVDLGTREPLDKLLGGLLPDLDVAATDLSGPLATAVRGDLVTRLGGLAELLVAPLLPHLGDRAVVLTPSGLLAGLPWTLLPGFVGRPVTIAQSATSWLARRSAPLRTTTAGFVAGPRVVRAEAEVEAAAKEWEIASVLTGADATAGAVSELAARVDVLHLAAHGRHSAQSPLFSGLQLADGPWFGYDIDQLAAVPDVVLLSACEVGRSTVRWGEELIGMTAAWLHAGARCVIASPAAVADVAAYDAFIGLHRGLADGLAPAEALAAVIGAPDADRPPAPFVCFC